MGKQLICVRCGFPIPKGALYTERRDGKPVHFGHTLDAIGDAIDAGGQIGFGKERILDKKRSPKKGRKRSR